jgi:hypothetical protein
MVTIDDIEGFEIEAADTCVDDALNAVIEMVSQHCSAGKDGLVYHTFGLSANLTAMDFLVEMGLMTKHKGGYTFGVDKLAARARKVQGS